MRNTSNHLLLVLVILVSFSMSAMMALAQNAPDTSMLPTPPNGYQWQLVPSLSDEFDGTSVGATKWLPHHPYWKGREPSQFDPANVSEEGGNLLLKSTTSRDNLTGISDPNKDIWVSAACVSSTTARAKYGYYEARVKASDLTMTSSFWLQGKYSEIDVVEELGNPVEHPEEARQMMTTTHFFPGGFSAGDKSTTTRWTMPTGSADDFHVYGVWWKDANTTIFYHNGKQVAELQTGGAFNEPMYLFFDTEVFAPWEGLPTIQDLKDPTKNTMAVDWVRSWKLVHTNGA